MMKRSLERGLGRGAAPKRSRSPRGPPVCISSIAQQARPKSMYQMLLVRPQFSIQLMTWSVFVVRTLPPSSEYFASQPLGGAIRFRFEDISLGSLRHRFFDLVLFDDRRARAARHVGHAARVALDRADPLEVALHPDVDQAQHQDGDEEEDLHQREHPAAGVDPAAE